VRYFLRLSLSEFAIHLIAGILFGSMLFYIIIPSFRHGYKARTEIVNTRRP